MRKVIHLFGVMFLLTSSGFAADDVSTKAVPLKTPPPKYTTELRAAGVEGTVVLRVAISAAGEVTECEVTNSTDKRLSPLAQAAVRNWRFKPATKNGEPVEARLAIPIKFELES